MQEDNLEDWIKNNKSSLDVETPDNEVIWEGIRANLGQTKSSSLKWIYWAAILIPLVGLGSYFLFTSTSPSDVPKYASVNLTSINPELAMLESNYQKTINTKLDAIEKEEFDKDQLGFLFEELGILDETNTEYQTDFAQVENERLVRTLIDYYEKKTRLLEKILVEIERQKQQKNERRTVEL